MSSRRRRRSRPRRTEIAPCSRPRQSRRRLVRTSPDALRNWAEMHLTDSESGRYRFARNPSRRRQSTTLVTTVASLDNRRRKRSLGRPFSLVWMSVIVSSTGDGMFVTAFPLLAATLTRDPVLIAGVTIASRLPWLFFSMLTGALADRMDRRRLMIGADLIRFVIVGAFGIAIAVGAEELWMLYSCAFLLGAAETLHVNAAQAIIPALIEHEQLLDANARFGSAQTAAAQFVGPPLGSTLFNLSSSIPFLADAVSFAGSAATGQRVTRRAPGGAGQNAAARRRARGPALHAPPHRAAPHRTGARGTQLLLLRGHLAARALHERSTPRRQDRLHRVVRRRRARHRDEPLVRRSPALALRLDAHDDDLVLEVGLDRDRARRYRHPRRRHRSVRVARLRRRPVARPQHHDPPTSHPPAACSAE